jgi:hypothetical protein
VARHRLLGFIPIAPVFDGSLKIGENVRKLRPVESPA